LFGRLHFSRHDVVILKSLFVTAQRGQMLQRLCATHETITQTLQVRRTFPRVVGHNYAVCKYVTPLKSAFIRRIRENPRPIS